MISSQCFAHSNRNLSLYNLYWIKNLIPSIYPSITSRPSIKIWSKAQSPTNEKINHYRALPCPHLVIINHIFPSIFVSHWHPANHWVNNQPLMFTQRAQTIDFLLLFSSHLLPVRCSGEARRFKISHRDRITIAHRSDNAGDDGVFGKGKQHVKIFRQRTTFQCLN